MKQDLQKFFLKLKMKKAINKRKSEEKGFSPGQLVEYIFYFDDEGMLVDKQFVLLISKIENNHLSWNVLWWKDGDVKVTACSEYWLHWVNDF